MKIYNQRQKRTYIIIALSIILLLMGVGYAAFSSMLNINGTASISNSWCVGFDITKTNTYTVKKGIETGQTPTGTMNYTGNACEINYKPNASLASAFYQPGDEIEYTLTIKNKSSVTAAIKSIVINGNESVSSDWTHTDGNISYKVFMPEDTTLDSNEETTMKVITKFQDDTPIEGSYTKETQTLSIAINSEQDDGDGGMITNPKFTGTIYRWSTTTAHNGDSIVPVSGTKWCAVITGPSNSVDSSCDNDTQEECEGEIESWGTPPEGYSVSCQQKTVTTGGIGEYTTDASTLNKTYYLKHDVVDDIITNSYVCFVYGSKTASPEFIETGYEDKEFCMKGADGGASFAANTQMIQEYQTFYSLNNVSNPSPRDPGCYFGSSDSRCYGGVFFLVDTDSDGTVYVYGVSSSYVPGSSSEYCRVYTDGRSLCDEE